MASGIPKKGSSRPTSATSRPASTRLTRAHTGPPPPQCPAAATSMKQQLRETAVPPIPKGYENPAFSIPLKTIHINPLEAELEKRKHIRRNIPKNEDLKELKKIVLSLKKRPDITVAEFVALIAPYVGDNGELLRAIIVEDTNSFRKLARRVYDTMSRDVSDVLTNQQIQIKENEQERTTLYTEKMMRAINEIYAHYRKFDFEMYYAEKGRYLSSIFPVPDLIAEDSEEAEMHRRMQAYHRLNWLRSEGDRIKEENVRLQNRLVELRQEHAAEKQVIAMKEKELEEQRRRMLEECVNLNKAGDNANDKVEETMIDTEAVIRQAVDEANINAVPEQKPKKGDSRSRKKSHQNWAAETAAEIEEKAVEESVILEGAQSDIEPESVAGVVRQVRENVSKTRVHGETTPERKPLKKQRSSFHFSPLKTPAPQPQPPKEKSPFHYSPIKTPPGKQPVQKPLSPFHYSPPRSPPRAPAPAEPVARLPQLHTTRVRTENVTVQERRASPPQARAASPTQARAPSPPQARAPSPPQARAPSPPQARGPSPPQARAPPAARAPPPARRGMQYAPKDSWGGFY